MALEACRVSFSYGGATVLRDVSLVVAPEQPVALDAPSGFGKTTLCRVLAGYLKPTGGSVLVDGQPLPTRGVRPVQLIGQHPERALDPRMRMGDSLAEGVRAGQRVVATEAGENPKGLGEEALLEALGIRTEWLARFPRELSGGEMQRFCIARALLARPRYLICDEISTMLDALTQARIWNVVLQEVQARQLGLLVVSHSPALVRRLGAHVVPLSRP